ncbi:MAG: protein kinase [Cyanobacteria bacterium TGS_CYA1]|nr:protein kinase [Cyanobacteria bacterium TGS_CYA1]
MAPNSGDTSQSQNLNSSSRKKACVVCGEEFDSEIEVCPTDGTKLTTLSSGLAPGVMLGDRYEIIEPLADGGMGSVYKARHKFMNRNVAVKTLQPFMMASGTALKRFQQEAQAVSSMNHPNILNVFDFFISDEGQPYLIMDYLEGTNLESIRKSGEPVDLVRALKIFVMVCSALAHAHERNIIHRDIKPSNIMLVTGDDGQEIVKVIDFGIAKVMADDPDEALNLTATGDVFGSPLYMSPEQCRAKPLDARSDIYSLGCVIYATISGESPFKGMDPMECMFKQVNDNAAPLSVACKCTLPLGLEEAVAKAIEKDPEKRYQTMREFGEALSNVLMEVSPETYKAISQIPMGTSTSTSVLPVQNIAAANQLEKTVLSGGQRVIQNSDQITGQNVTSTSSSTIPPLDDPETKKAENHAKVNAIATVGILIVMGLAYFIFQPSYRPVDINSISDTTVDTTRPKPSRPANNNFTQQTAPAPQPTVPAISTPDLIPGDPTKPPTVKPSSTKLPNAPKVTATMPKQTAAQRSQDWWRYQYWQQRLAQQPAVQNTNTDANYQQNMAAGIKLFRAKNFSQAQAYFEKAHKIASSFGTNDPRYINSLDWVAQVAFRLGNYEDSKHAYEYVLYARKKSFGPNSTEAASTQKDLDLVNKALKRD